MLWFVVVVVDDDDDVFIGIFLYFCFVVVSCLHNLCAAF